MASPQLLPVRAGRRFLAGWPHPAHTGRARKPDPSQRPHPSPSCPKHLTCSSTFGILVVVMGVFASLVRAPVVSLAT